MSESNTEVKTCPICGSTKPITEFSPHSKYKGKQYYATRCKTCDNERAKLYYRNNSEKIKPKNRLYANEYYQNNREKCKENARKYLLSLTPQEKEQLQKYKKAWRQANAEKLKQQRTEYRKSPAGRLVRNVRNRMSKKIGKIRKLVSISKSVGKTPSQLQVHIESLWLPGMSWENYGKEWHVDHIKPLAAFNLSDATQQAAANHYSNLQPLWAVDNLAKGAKYDDAVL